MAAGTTKLLNRKINIFLLGILVLLPFSSLKAAQQKGTVSASKDIVKKRGRGVGVGRGSIARFHFGTDLGLGYSTNPYSLAEKDTPQGDMLIKVRPSLSLSARGRKLLLSMGLEAEFGILPHFDKIYPDYSGLLYNSSLHGSAELNPGGKGSFFFQDTFSTSRNPAELFVGNLATFQNQMTLGTRIRPGGGAGTIELGGQYHIQAWPKEVNNDLDLKLDTEALYFTSRVTWNVLRRTQTYVDLRFGRFKHIDEDEIRTNPLWAKFGVGTRISKKINGAVSVGFASPFLADSTKHFEVLPQASLGLTAAADVSWEFARQSSLSVGLMRDMMPVPSFLDLMLNSAYISYSHTFARRFVLAMSPSLTFLEFGKPKGARLDDSKFGRKDIMGGFKVDLKYDIKDWLAVGVSYDTALRWTNAGDVDVTGEAEASLYSGTNGQKLLYQRHELLALISFHY